MNQFKQYEKYKKSLNKEGKRELNNAIFFLRTAMTSTLTLEALTLEATENHRDWLDDNGWAEFYEMIMQICDEILLSDDSVFLTYIKLEIKGEAEDAYFDYHYDTCYDWYFMDKAREELDNRMN